MIPRLLAEKALLLGIVEGLTEFLPVSSTGHLILAGDALHFNIPSANLFEVVIQLGAILAVCWLYRAKLWDVLIHLRRRPQQMFALKLFIAFLPAALMGATCIHFIEEKLFSSKVVAISCFAGALVIWTVERWKPAPTVYNVDDISLRRALAIGCAQAFAVIPGTSRSGAAIVGGLLSRVERKAATEFSFFLAIPTMLAATVFDLYKHAGAVAHDDMSLIAIGFVAAFCSGLLAVKFFTNFVGKHTLMPFAIYRILLGAVLIWFYYCRPGV